MATLTATRLREVLAYDPETGDFTWRVGVPGRVMGAVGSPDEKGYLRICIDGRTYRNHRLAFLYMTGAWPPDQIDHTNGIVTDNRWINLRPATNSENGANAGVQKNNRLGFRGVRRWRQKYRARISHNGRTIDLGLYATAEKAAAAYQEAAQRLFGKFSKSFGANPVPILDFKAPSDQLSD
jgi:hypothetical protein